MVMATAAELVVCAQGSSRRADSLIMLLLALMLLVLILLQVMMHARHPQLPLAGPMAGLLLPATVVLRTHLATLRGLHLHLAALNVRL